MSTQRSADSSKRPPRSPSDTSGGPGETTPCGSTDPAVLDSGAAILAGLLTIADSLQNPPIEGAEWALVLKRRTQELARIHVRDGLVQLDRALLLFRTKAADPVSALLDWCQLLGEERAHLEVVREDTEARSSFEGAIPTSTLMRRLGQALLLRYPDLGSKPRMVFDSLRTQGLDTSLLLMDQQGRGLCLDDTNDNQQSLDEIFTRSCPLRSMLDGASRRLRAEAIFVIEADYAWSAVMDCGVVSVATAPAGRVGFLQSTIDRALRNARDNMPTPVSGVHTL